MPKGKELIAFDETKSIRQWSFDKRCKVPYQTLISRLKTGMEAEKAISTKQIDDCKMQVGDTINRLTLRKKWIKRLANGKTRTMGEFQCSCKNKTIHITAVSLVYNEHTKSCGCYADEVRGFIHGKGGSKPLLALHHAIARCYNIKDDRYLTYGGRGIKVCDEWKNKPIEFYNWSMINGCKEGLSIDRLDENWHYCPENCRWATKEQQLESSENNRQILAWNEVKSVLYWTRDNRCKTDINTIKKRLAEGWLTEDAISKPEDINT